MADKPVLFSGPMVRALLAGTKTQTRRDASKAITYTDGKPVHIHGGGGGCFCAPNDEAIKEFGPYYMRFAVGDRLYVREHWRTTKGLDAYSPSEIGQQCLDEGFESPWCPVQFISDDVKDDALHWHGEVPGKFRQGMHMPRWASRITLTVTDVRVERLQDISDEDVKAEGMPDLHYEFRFKYKDLWDSINGAGAWETNPWVAAYTFTVAMGNIDDLARPSC